MTMSAGLIVMTTMITMAGSAIAVQGTNASVFYGCMRDNRVKIEMSCSTSGVILINDIAFHRNISGNYCTFLRDLEVITEISRSCEGQYKCFVEANLSNKCDCVNITYTCNETTSTTATQWPTTTTTTTTVPTTPTSLSTRTPATTNVLEPTNTASGFPTTSPTTSEIEITSTPSNASTAGQSPHEADDDDDTLDVGLIVGVSVGAVVAVAMVAMLIAFIVKRRRRNAEGPTNTDRTDSQMYENTIAADSPYANVTKAETAISSLKNPGPQPPVYQELAQSKKESTYSALEPAYYSSVDTKISRDSETDTYLEPITGLYLQPINNAPKT